MAVNLYFIDKSWRYYEIFIVFEFIYGKYTGLNLADIFNVIITRYDLLNILFALITDNVLNNKILYTELIKILKKELRKFIINFNKFKNLSAVQTFRSKFNNKTELVPCLIYILQLNIKKLLGYICIIPNNDELKRN